MKKITVLLAISLLSLLPINAELIRVPGTNVALTPPADFTKSELFPGFEHAGSGSTIMVMEMPGPLSEVTAGMNKKDLAKVGITFIQKEEIKFNEHQAKLFDVRQNSEGITYAKWMLVFGDLSSSVMLLGTSPESTDVEIRNKIKESLFTTIWNKNAQTEFFEGLKFSINESDELKYAKRISDFIILARVGEFGKPVPGKPSLVAGFSHSQVDIENLADYSNQRLLQTAKMLGIKLIQEKEISIDGHLGYEVIASAVKAETDMPMRVYQVIVPVNSSYLIIQGSVAESTSEKYLQQFREIANSVTFDL